MEGGGESERLRELGRRFLQERREGGTGDPAAFSAAHPDAAGLRELLEGIAAGDPDTELAELERRLAEPTVEATLPLGEVPAEPTELFDRRYRVVKTLGQGGFGKVFLVEDTLHGNERLALKLVLPEHQEKEDFARRFRNEIRVLRTLQHPGIPQIFNDGLTPAGEVYFTMAYVVGRTLEDVLKEKGVLPPLDVARYVRQILSVLDYAHARGVVHRDLKPSNVVVTGEGEPDEQLKVLDFGIAKILRRDGALQHAMTMQTQMPIGTPHYMSPEQVRGDDVDGRTDLYALGVMIYRMVSGAYPFSGKSMMEILAARLQEDPTPLRAEGSSPWIARLCRELLEREREKRPSTERIETLLRDALEERRDTNALLRRVLAGGGVVAVVAVLALLRPWTWGGGERPASGGAEPERTAEPAVPPAGGSQGGPAPGAATPGAAPSAELAEPAEGAHLAATRVSVSGRARDAGAVVAVNGVRLALEESGAFRGEVSLPEGAAELEVRDAASGELLASRRVVVDATPPAVELADLPGEEIEAGLWLVGERSLQLAGAARDAAPGELARLEVDGRPVAVAADGSFTCAVELPRDGRQRVVLEARDRAGNRGTAALEVLCDTEPPGLDLPALAPVPRGATEVVVSGRVSDASPVEVIVAGATAAVDQNGRFSARVSVSPDAVELRVRAVDRTGRETGEVLRVVRSEAEASAAGPLVPSGCAAVAGSGTGGGGFARRVRHARTGMELVLVEPAGLEPFYVGANEVTWAQYERSSAKAPRPSFGPGDDHPVVNVSFEDAQAFCRWAELALPTEAQWLAAARGSAGGRYPWGDAWDAARCNAAGDGDGWAQTAPAALDLGDRAECGALGFAGNVSEWCASESGEKRMLGGSYLDDETGCELAPRRGLLPRAGAANVGFRVALAADGGR